jgi:hypothetical protein
MEFARIARRDPGLAPDEGTENFRAIVTLSKVSHSGELFGDETIRIQLAQKRGTIVRHPMISSCVVIMLLVAGGWFEPVSLYAKTNSAPSIVDFHPGEFEAKADAPFFYSVGDELKYSDSIDSDAPTRFRGEVENFQVSPNGKLIALVSGHKLLVVDFLGKVQIIGAVDSIYRTFKPFGRSFIRDEEFQWSRDSKSLYFIKDTFYRSKGSQLFSEFGELWRFEIESGEQQLVIKPFRAYQIILGRGSDIYFAIPLPNGDLILELFDGKAVIPNTAPLFSASEERPFYSFSRVDYSDKILSGLRLRQNFDFKGNLQTLSLGDKTLLELTRYCDAWQGCRDGDEMMDSVFLPGNRFFLLNVPYCSNYKGQILIDTQTGNYKTLPKDTRVFITANTETYPHYKFNHEGIEAEDGSSGRR